MPSKALQQRVRVLEEQLVEKENELIHSILSHFTEDELLALISLVDKAGSNGSLLNNKTWMMTQLTPQEISVRNQYAELWNQMGGRQS